MILFCSIIIGCIIAFSLLNIFVFAPIYNFSILYSILGVIFAVIFVIAVDGLFAAIIRRMPEKWFFHEKKFFQVSTKEKKFYEKIKIRKWKDKIPELGQFTNFRKNKVDDPHNNEYLARYMLEACYGEVIHLAGVFAGFLIIFFFPLKYWLCFGFPVAFVNIFMNLPSFFILRYNFYKMKILFNMNIKREKRKEKIKQGKLEEKI